MFNSPIFNVPALSSNGQESHQYNSSGMFMRGTPQVPSAIPEHRGITQCNRPDSFIGVSAETFDAPQSWRFFLLWVPWPHAKSNIAVM
jgi:hypothetical protein